MPYHENVYMHRICSLTASTKLCLLAFASLGTIICFEPLRCIPHVHVHFSSEKLRLDTKCRHASALAKSKLFLR